MSSPPVCLETDRLFVRAPLPIELAGAVCRFQSRNADHFAPWDPRRSPAFHSEAYWVEQLHLDAEDLDAGRRARFFVSEKITPNRVVGHVHFSNIVRGAFWACHLGFAIDQALEGTGTMYEALFAAIEWAFDELNLHRIEANHRPENVRSGALLRRLEFVPQGYARDYLRIDGAWRDHVLTALTNEQWKSD